MSVKVGIVPAGCPSPGPGTQAAARAPGFTCVVHRGWEAREVFQGHLHEFMVTLLLAWSTAGLLPQTCLSRPSRSVLPTK